MEMLYRYTPDQWEQLVDRRAESFNLGKFEAADEFEPCAVCRNKRQVASRRGSGQEASLQVGDCACMDMVRQKDAMRRSGMEKLLMQFGFGNYLVREGWQKQLFDKARQCADTDNWLLLCGQSGCGKTHLAVALCRELIARGQQVVYMSWVGNIRSICAAAFDLERRERLLRPFLEAPVLLLDDLFKTRVKDGLPEVSRQELDVAFEIIDHRSVRNLRTIITSEVTTQQLTTLSQALMGRIAEKAGEFVQNIKPDSGRNWRTRPA